MKAARVSPVFDRLRTLGRERGYAPQRSRPMAFSVSAPLVITCLAREAMSGDTISSPQTTVKVVRPTAGYVEIDICETDHCVRAVHSTE